MIDGRNSSISIVRQCDLLQVQRSGFYYEPVPAVSADDLMVMRRMDELYTRYPYYGSPRMTVALQREGIVINHKRVERLMRVMGLVAIYPKKRHKSGESEGIRYPYLLSDLPIIRPNQVWGTDITYIRLKNGFIYCVALIDWFARYIVSWKLSTTMHVDFCINALQEALTIAQPEIHNSDQGSQFTSTEYIATIQQYPKINISMDGKGRCFDNIFTERFWRTLKYEEVYINDYQSFDDAQQSIARYIHIYNNERLHSALDYHTPAEIYFQAPLSSIH